MTKTTESSTLSEAKTCKDCNQSLAICNFKSSINTENGRRYYDTRCDECRRLYNRNRDRRPTNVVLPGLTVHGLQSRYCLTKFSAMIIAAKQNYACAICHREFTDSIKANVDHSHETGKVRGFLCYSCNTGIGQLRDDPILLQRAIDYLNQSVVLPEYTI